MVYRQKRHEAAVSPVIGVMLMIVVTIIIAAVVSAFAGGFSDQQKKTPSSQIDVTLKSVVNGSGLATPQLIFAHKGGDPVASSDLRIVTYVNGNKHETDGSLLWSESQNHFAEAMVNDVWPDTHFTSNNGYQCKVGSGGTLPDCMNGGEWGAFTLMNGDVLTTNTDKPAQLRSILGSEAMGQLEAKTSTSGNYQSITYSGPLKIEIIHIPSGRVIASSELMYG